MNLIYFYSWVRYGCTGVLSEWEKNGNHIRWGGDARIMHATTAREIDFATQWNQS